MWLIRCVLESIYHIYSYAKWDFFPEIWQLNMWVYLKFEYKVPIDQTMQSQTKACATKLSCEILCSYQRFGTTCRSCLPGSTNRKEKTEHNWSSPRAVIGKWLLKNLKLTTGLKYKTWINPHIKNHKTNQELPLTRSQTQHKGSEIFKIISTTNSIGGENCKSSSRDYVVYKSRNINVLFNPCGSKQHGSISHQNCCEGF
jgi:hypothetical protein